MDIDTNKPVLGKEYYIMPPRQNPSESFLIHTSHGLKSARFEVRFARQLLQFSLL